MRSANYFFKEDELIDQQYKVKSLISINDYAQTYRVRNPAFEAKVLKLFLKEANTELSVLERLDSPHVVKLDSVGQVRVNGSNYSYAILDYVNGDSLFERTERQEMLSFIGAYNVFLGIINALIYLRRLHPAVDHYRILPKNIILNLASNAFLPVLANFSSSGAKDIDYTPDEMFFIAPEMLLKQRHESTDLYSAAAIYYYLLHGHAPFSKEMNAPAMQAIPFEEALFRQKQSLVDFHVDLYDSTRYIIRKAMHPDPTARYQDPAEIRRDLYKDPHDPCFSEYLAALK